MQRLRAVFAAVLLSALVSPALSQSRWSDPATWGGSVPNAGDKVTVPKGTTIVLDASPPPLRGLLIEGTLIAGDNDIRLTSDYVVVKGGCLQIGTATSPYNRNAVITLTGSTVNGVPEANGLGSKVLGLIGGTLSLHGRRSVRTWTKLAADAPASARSITLAEAPGWRVGDQIVIATSSSNQNHFDVARITGINGSTLQLDTALRYRKIGSRRQFGNFTVDARAEVGLLSRNIVVQGDDNSTQLNIGGHAMFMNGMCPSDMGPNCQCGVSSRMAKVQISAVEFRRMGQLNQTGRYPVHFHQMGQTSDCYIRDASIHSSIQRGLVLHDVSGVEVTGNVLFNTVGHNLVVETEITTGNTIVGNLALVNRQAVPLQTNPVFVAQNDRLPSNFWMKSGRNVVAHNAAAGSFSSGFNYDGIRGDGPLNFRNNTAHAAMGAEGAGEGDFDLAAGVLIVGEEARPSGDVIADNLVYHNRIGFWPEESGPFVVDRMMAVDNLQQTENRGVGNVVVYRDSLFVGLFSEPRAHAGDAVHFQYGSDVHLQGALFANYAGGSIASFTDIALPSQANLWVSGIQTLGAKPAVSVGDDQVTTYSDDSVLPRGTYTFLRQYAGPGAVRVNVTTGDDVISYWRTSQRYRTTELDVRDRASLSTRIHGRALLTRSDGHTYRGGMFGYPVVYDGGFTFSLPASSQGYAFRLNRDSMFDAALSSPNVFVSVAVPVAKVPTGVHRGTEGGRPSTPTDANRLRRATTLGEFLSNPLTTFWYDASARRVLVNANLRWVIVVP